MSDRKLPDERPFLKTGLSMGMLRRFEESQRERQAAAQQERPLVVPQRP